MSAELPRPPSADPPADASPSLGTFAALSHGGLLRAEAALSQFLGHGVRFTTLDVRVAPLDVLTATVAGAAPGSVAGLTFAIDGGAAGDMVILFPVTTILRMLETLQGGARPAEALSAMERSALEEIGNILASAFLTELSDRTRRRLLPSPPRLLLDELPSAMADVHTASGAKCRERLVIRGVFGDPARGIEGHFFVLPAEDHTEGQPA